MYSRLCLDKKIGQFLEKSEMDLELTIKYHIFAESKQGSRLDKRTSGFFVKT
jgi:hypothetical protein